MYNSGVLKIARDAMLETVTAARMDLIALRKERCQWLCVALVGGSTAVRWNTNLYLPCFAPCHRGGQVSHGKELERG